LYERAIGSNKFLFFSLLFSFLTDFLITSYLFWEINQVPKTIFFGLSLSFLTIIFLFLKREIYFSKIDLGFLFIFFAVLPSYFSANDKVWFLFHLLVFILTYLSYLIAFNTFKREYIYWFSILIVLLSLIGLFQSLVQIFLLRCDWLYKLLASPKHHLLLYIFPIFSSRFEQASGSTCQPNLFCLFLSITSLCSAYLFLKTKKLWFLLTLFLNTFTMQLTKSRAGFLDFLFVFSLFLYFLKNTNREDKLTIKRLIFWACFGHLVGFFFLKIIAQSTLINKVFISSGYSSRLAIWLISLILFLKHPLTGVGLGNFKTWAQLVKIDIAREYSWVKWNPAFLTWAHNEYLHFLCETGIIGFLAILIFIWLIGKQVLRLLKTEPSLEVILTICMLIPFFIHSLFSFPFHFPPLNMLFGILCGMLMKLSAVKTRPLNLSFKFGFFLVSLAILYLVYHSSLAEIKLKHLRSEEYRKTVTQKTLKKDITFMLSDLFVSRYTKFTLAGIYYKVGVKKNKKRLIKDAIKYWEEIFKVMPQVKITYFLADAYNRLGQTDKASYWRKFYEIPKRPNFN